MSLPSVLLGFVTGAFFFSEGGWSLTLPCPERPLAWPGQVESRIRKLAHRQRSLQEAPRAGRITPSISPSLCTHPSSCLNDLVSPYPDLLQKYHSFANRATNALAHGICISTHKMNHAFCHALMGPKAMPRTAGRKG